MGQPEPNFQIEPDSVSSVEAWVDFAEQGLSASALEYWKVIVFCWKPLPNRGGRLELPALADALIRLPRARELAQGEY